MLAEVKHRLGCLPQGVPIEAKEGERGQAGDTRSGHEVCTSLRSVLVKPEVEARDAHGRGRAQRQVAPMKAAGRGRAGCPEECWHLWDLRILRGAAAWGGHHTIARGHRGEQKRWHG